MLGKTVAEKILSEHSGMDARAGEIVFCKIDGMMAHDANGPLAVKAFRDIGGQKVADASKIHFIFDHACPAPNERIANLHAYLRTFAQEQGIELIDVGDGVCHQIMVEKGYAKPWQLIVGTDSHTCTYGAVGAFATGIGATDMGTSFLTGINWFKVPQTVRVNLNGQLAANCDAKDVILYIIGKVTASGGNYLSFEFYGDYLEQCTLADRMTIANMVVEMGGKAGFMCCQATGVKADEGALYLKTIDIDLGDIRPSVAKPHTVDNYARVADIAGLPFTVAFLGSCTNGRIQDLREAANILKGKHVAPGVRLLVIPASKQVMLDAMAEGVAQTLMDAGGFFFTPGCGACVGTHGGVPGDGEVALSTANRNFKGRMGNNNAFIYLVSPKTLAQSCLTGVLTEPVL